MESTIGLLFTIIIAIPTLTIVFVIGLATYATMNTDPSQHIVQQAETTGNVRRPYIEARTGERVDAMSCDLTDPYTGSTTK